MKPFVKEKILPLSLTAFVILVDQITKALIVGFMEIGDIFDVFNRVPIQWVDMHEKFFVFYHVRNPAIAFSLGSDLVGTPWQPILFVIIPVLVLVFLIWYFFKSDDFTRLQRWAAAGIIGGGIGNIIDRIFRPEGVVDFFSVRIFGLFGMERWPTFNVADSAVVVCCLLLLVTLFIPAKKNQKAEISG
ncbi:MAG: signal peptidase II [Treponema sp.]|nr:signal peptidase II [Treponema sp.]